MPDQRTRGLECLIEPHLTVDVATVAAGVVKEIRVDRGHFVKSGQVLAQLESEIEKANLAYARAKADYSSKKYQRVVELHKEQMISSQQLEETKAENEVAQAELKKAAEILGQRTIVSPLSGVIVERYVSPGEFVENKKIVKVAQVQPLNVELIAPVAMMGAFAPGNPMQVSPEGPTAGPFEARVKLVDRVIDAASGTFRVRLELPNPQSQISAGIRCKAWLVETQHAKVDKPKPTSGLPKTSKPVSAKSVMSGPIVGKQQPVELKRAPDEAAAPKAKKPPAAATPATPDTDAATANVAAGVSEASAPHVEAATTPAESEPAAPKAPKSTLRVPVDVPPWTGWE